jgi:DNA polymerase III epsilon subunit-like protein
MKYVSIDIETTGLNPDKCEILEMAAVYDNNPVIPIEQLPVFRYRVKKDTYTGEPYALHMHQRLLFDIATHPVNVSALGRTSWDNQYGSPVWLAKKFQSWLYDQDIDPHCFNVAGKNFANFDARFLRQLDGWKQFIKWHHRILDPGSMYVRPGDTQLPGTGECCGRAGIYTADEIDGSKHEALFDARVVVALVRKAMK